MNTPNYNQGISFKEKSIGMVYLTGGGLIDRPFKGVGVDSRFGWEHLTWKSNPSRSLTSEFTNMDDIDVYLIARCEITINFANIHDYMDLRKILGRERHFYAEFFNTDTGEWIRREMYCSENTVSKFFMLGQRLIGAQDYTIKLVGTNRDLKEDGTITKDYTITYNANGGEGTIASEKTKWGGQVTISDGTGLTAPTGKHLKYWEARTTKDGQTVVNGYYAPNQSTTIWTDMNLYAIWE